MGRTSFEARPLLAERELEMKIGFRITIAVVLLFACVGIGSTSSSAATATSDASTHAPDAQSTAGCTILPSLSPATKKRLEDEQLMVVKTAPAGMEGLLGIREGYVGPVGKEEDPAVLIVRSVSERSASVTYVYLGRLQDSASKDDAWSVSGQNKLTYVSDLVINGVNVHTEISVELMPDGNSFKNVWTQTRNGVENPQFSPAFATFTRCSNG